jgi:acetyl esterase
MKKIILGFIGFFLLAVATAAALIYRWTFTPFGRLHPVMGVLHKLMSLVTRYGKFDRNDIPRVRQLMDLVQPTVPIAKVIDRSIDGPERSIPIRIYRPEGNGPFPVIVFFHGGGFTIGSIGSHENVTRSLANSTSSIVMSAGYRLAPENPFPAAVDDAYAAVQWAEANASEFDGDPKRLAVAGDSAGGNLAAAVCLRARNEEGPSIGLQILLYPATILTDTDSASRRDFFGYVLTEESGQHVLDAYLPNKSDRDNPYASPLLAGDHSGLPPAYIMTAAFDPLLDEGNRYARRLEEAGVPVTYRKYDGMLHGFLSYGDLVSFFPPLTKLLKEPNQVYGEVAQAVEQWL